MRTRTIMETIKDLCKKNGIADLYVFGSRSEEIVARLQGSSTIVSMHSASDVDIGAMPVHFSKFGPAERISLAIELEDLFDVPRVDVVLLPEADPYMALEIIRGELLYTDDPNRQARHELYILRRAGDLMPFKKLRMKMILEEEAR